MIRIINVLLLILLFITAGCNRNEERYKQDEKIKQRQQLQSIIQTLSYIRDTRTGLCFAYTWAGPTSGGPAFTYVPCEGLEGILISTSGVTP